MNIADANKAVAVERPVPHLSAPSVEFIVDKLKNGRFDFVVEYGSGASTRFFLRELLDFGEKCTFISVETMRDWFLEVINMIKQDMRSRTLSEEMLIVKPWNRQAFRDFLNGSSQTVLKVPEQLRRLPGIQAKFKDHPVSRLRFRLVPGLRPHDGSFSVAIDGKIAFCYQLHGEMFRDQYGESPRKTEYISAGLGPIKKALVSGGKPVKAAFMIDGGPRADTVNAILDLEEGSAMFHPSIFLFEAQRVFCNEAMNRRKTGRILRGSNRTLSGEIVYEVKRPVDAAKFAYWYGKQDATAEEMAEKEMWYYAR